MPDIHLLLSGDRTHPDEEAIRLAVELQDRFADLIPIIAVASLEHYLPYRRAVEAGVFGNAPKPFPMIDSADQVWPYVCLEQVIIEPQRDVMTVEFDYSISWDEEHTVGARFCHWQFVELCGSV